MSLSLGGSAGFGNGAEMPPAGVWPLTPAQAGPVFDDIDLSAQHEVLIFITAPFAKLTVVHGADDPVRVASDKTVLNPERRVIYDPRVLNNLHAVGGLRNAAQVGTRIRASRMPLTLKAIMADGVRALMSRTPLDPHDPRTYQYIEDPGIVMALRMMFEYAWSSRQTLAYDPDRGVYDDRMPVLSPRQRAVYQEVMAGASNAAIAKITRLSVRTVTRTLTQLYELAGVTSKAQFLAHANQHWV